MAVKIEMIERVFPANTEEVPVIVQHVSELAEEAGVHPKRIMHLELAVEEAVMNICSYAYETPPGTVAVRVSTNKGAFTVQLVDEGIPFDPLALEEPDIKAELEDRQIGGLGVLLIRRVMDEVHYQREGGSNILTMTLLTNQ
jgi:anti-sigma regulatory factor (Ser/Thr protein kinase)